MSSCSISIRRARSPCAAAPPARSASATPRGASDSRPTATAARELTYSYDAAIGGKVASIGGRLLDGATRVIIGQFFTRAGAQGWRRWLRSGGGFSLFALLAKLASLFGGRR